ncbi:hypothetical protein [Branchiibius sp. NY16-3462-2]|uniref:hypothetical protein n=1 Tax=Branchiibius sp. NY16-3462-2 TaxID=1807500 RepID=UPI0007911FF0|nr:hypothetical protein [Branchiibius sp. NY16-3462-2]KYH43236.1 hypothetical protein AZH51_12845 [Branchiibius sp. NY16-3462-2]
MYVCESRKTGYRFESELELYWEVSGDPLSDDYAPSQISAAQLFSRYLARCSERPQRRVWWAVSGIGNGKFEAAPFQDDPLYDGNWLTHYTWPVDVITGERVNFATLPVVDKLWRPGRADKGGFIQEATGWKPAPLQSSINIINLARAAGLA